jgi:hypothetical protein
MNKRYTLAAYIIFILSSAAFTQTATEALRLSFSDPLGTARNMGTGNSMFAIGPDFSAIGSNPAGIAGYWKSEFTMSLGFTANSAESYFSTDRDATSSENFNHLSLPSVGFVIVNRPVNSVWKTSNWAIGLNRVADYKREIDFAGHTLGSITDSWRENATGVSPDDLNGFEEGLAYTSGAIYDFEEDNLYETDYNLSNNYALYKEEFSTLDGGKSELFLGYGANLDNKLLVGFSINLPLLNFTEDRSYSEFDEAGDGVPFFNNLEYNRYVNTTGYGLNAKVGVTLKPSKFINVALALHTPTKFHLTDNYNSTLSYDYTDENNDGPIRSESPYGSFEYALRTPWSATGGLGVLAGKSGFISASVKWTDYSGIKYDYSVRGNGNEYNEIEREVNADIKHNYGSALDLHIGGEMVLSSLRVRGGVSLAQSPYNNDDSFDPSYHAGIGYRADEYFIDLGYMLTSEDDGYLPYETIDAPQPLVITDNTRHRLSLTLGLKF